ncbi:MAG: hypothetical protein IJM17_03735, partial [Firmicutes bacterium]|nr:hypothetical protein [Bacillota bacterium]
MNTSTRKPLSRAIAVFVCAVLVCGSLSPMLAQKAFAEDSSSYANGESIFNRIENMASQAPDDFDVQKDPYGHGMNKEFMLATQDELFVIQGNGTEASNPVKVYDNLKQANESSSPLSEAESVTNLSSITNDLSYVQMVSFDPDKTGRKDHIAVLGVNYWYDGNTGNAYTTLSVFDKNGNREFSKTVGKAEWMEHHEGGNDDMRDFNAMNFLSITAGDFRGTGRDSIVIWQCVDNNNYGLSEWIKDPDTGTYTCPSTDKYDNNKYYVGEKALLHDKYPDIYATWLSKNNNQNWVDNKLHCQLRSGDINGDGLDDLIVLSYVNRVTHDYLNSYKMYSQVTDLYRPCLAVRYGAKSAANMVSSYDTRYGIWKADNSDRSRWTSMLAGGVAVGDIDGDAVDEIVVSGFKNTIEGESGKEVDDPYTITKSKMVTAIFDGTGGSLTQLMFNSDFDTNGWTKGADIGGLYVADTEGGDQSWQRTAVETVAINGKAKAKNIFINGDLYAYNATARSITVVYQPAYFSETDQYFGNYDGNLGMRVAETYFRSVAVGVFDGNENDREQIVYVLGATKNGDPDNALFKIGMMGGVFTDSQGLAVDEAVSWYSTLDEPMEKTVYPSGGSASANVWDRLNFAVCAWDCDCDGLHAKYVRKEFVYTDPQVIAILQAPPYFEELRGQTVGSTSYTISNSYSYGIGTGKSTSFGIGLAVDLGSPCCKINFGVDARQDWSQSFSNSLTTTDEYTFTAEGEDQVIVKRTPITIYIYQVETFDEWSDDNTFALSFPGVSAYETLNARDYNDYVEYYNNKYQELAVEANAQRAANGLDPIKAEDIPHLDLLEDQWLFNEGDPFSYMRKTSVVNGRTVLQSSPNTFGVGESSTSYSWSQEHSHETEETYAFGFSFDITFMLGGKGFGWEIFGGVHSSLEYMKEYSTSESKSVGQGVSCEVANMKLSDLEEIGISPEAASEYGFQYQMVSWPSNLPNDFDLDAYIADNDYDDEALYEELNMEKLEQTPIYGYM